MPTLPDSVTIDTLISLDDIKDTLSPSRPRSLVSGCGSAITTPSSQGQEKSCPEMVTRRTSEWVTAILENIPLVSQDLSGF